MAVSGRCRLHFFLEAPSYLTYLWIEAYGEQMSRTGSSRALPHPGPTGLYVNTRRCQKIRYSDVTTTITAAYSG